MSDKPIDLTGASKIGVIGDTHGLVRPELYDLLDGVDAILHSGDIGDDEVEISLNPIAPFYAVAGNVDGFAQSEHPRRRLVTIGSKRIGLTHIVLHGKNLVASVQAWRREVSLDILIFGHTHEPLIESHSSGILLFNPGSCGPRRFRLPISAGLLHVQPDGELKPEILRIAN